jgi:hypothetical protein
MEFPSGWISPQSKKLLDPLTVTQIKVLDRIVMPRLLLEEFVFSAPDEASRATENPARRRAPIPGPTEFAVNLKAYVEKIAASCPLCGHREVQRDREEGETT